MPDRDSQPDLHLLRMLADDELTGDDLLRAQQLAQGENEQSHVSRRILEGERNLKHAVGKLMGSPHAPQSLRAQVVRILETSGALEGASSANASSEAVAGRIGLDDQRDSAGIEHANVVRRSPFTSLFASPQRANFAAVAAVLALIVGAVLFGIYGRTIDDVPVQPAVDVAGNVAIYADAEHDQSTKKKSFIGKGKDVWSSVPDAEVHISELLGETFRVFDLTSLGYTFVAATPTNAPLNEQPSARLTYRKSLDVDSSVGALVSILVAPFRGCCTTICAGMHAGEWRVADIKACKRRVVYSTDSRLLYFLVCCDERDQADIAQMISRIAAATGR